MTQSLGSWGRYPNAPQTPHACHWQSHAAVQAKQLAAQHQHFLPHGNGRSYGDSCLAASDHVLHMRGLDRFLAADWTTGVVHAEAGMTLDELLRVCVPRGWFLPVTPGTKFATLGGAVANDVHGKNHHVRGTFGCHVSALTLVRSDASGALVCSPTANAHLFACTVGGLGLTGVILSVELQLMRISSSDITNTSHRFGNLSEFFALSNQLDAQHEYTVAWVDCIARGSALGRGIFFAGDHADQGTLYSHQTPRLRVPFTPPASALNPFTLSAFNGAYYHLPRQYGKPASAHYDGFFYPLDRVLGWNKLYGWQGFQQHQCVVPQACAQGAVTALLQAIGKAKRGSFLAVLKRCGSIASPGLLSFPMPGVSLALDFAQHQDLQDALFPTLDAIVREAGGRLYSAKDAHMTASDFQAFYPQWETLESARDPALMSHFWKRVTAS